MRKLIVTIVIAVIPLTALADAATKRAAIHHMLSIIGSDFPEGSSELAAFEGSMSEQQVATATAFFESEAGQQFLAASRGAQKHALQKLDHAIEDSRRKRVVNDLRAFDSSIEGPDVPIIDPWGNPYKQIHEHGHNRYVSAGPDGVFAPDSLKAGVTKGEFGDDYVYEDGDLIAPKK